MQFQNQKIHRCRNKRSHYTHTMEVVVEAEVEAVEECYSFDRYR
jgi:hypothetical protein